MGHRTSSSALLTCCTPVPAMVLDRDVTVFRRFQYLFWPCLPRCFLPVKNINGGAGHGVRPDLSVVCACSAATHLLGGGCVADEARKGRLKHFRRIATHFDKLARNFLATVMLSF